MRTAAIRRSLRTAVVALGALVALGGAGAAASAHSPAPENAVTASVAAVPPQRKLVGIQRLSDGSVAKIYKVGDRYEAAIFFRGKKIATLSSKKTVFRHHGVNYSFHPYKGSIWAEKNRNGKYPRPVPGPVKPVPNPTPDDDVVTPVPNPTPDDDVVTPVPNPTPDDDVVTPVPNPAPDEADAQPATDTATDTAAPQAADS
ncbi:hypothetical protein [Streptomyces sp. NPDC088762]|uniref:hypothetical protein n=1 Tax=Streptomyces sp. NPDC088762 TaxID=3365891 RepID=UPI0037FF7930